MPEPVERHLVLVRHAEAMAQSRHGSDSGRPLTERGRKQAGALARRLLELPIDWVLCSAAVRARETLAPYLEASPPPGPPVTYDATLLGACSKAILDRLAGVGPEILGILVVGHNPALEEFASELLAEGRAETLPRMAPATCVHLAASLPWELWGGPSCHLVACIQPSVD